jgi:NAD(P)-dependent dehydrogenase (short-subunit alcohol dehydrogenase family)
VTTAVPNQNRFEGKVSLVTGASSGIGLAVAERLSSEGAELFVTAHPRDAERLEEVVRRLRRQGRRVESLAVDQANPTVGPLLPPTVGSTSRSRTPASRSSRTSSRHRMSIGER